MMRGALAGLLRAHPSRPLRAAQCIHNSGLCATQNSWSSGLLLPTVRAFASASASATPSNRDKDKDRFQDADPKTPPPPAPSKIPTKDEAAALVAKYKSTGSLSTSEKSQLREYFYYRTIKLYTERRDGPRLRARAYANANKDADEDCWRAEKLDFISGTGYTHLKKLGSGRYSYVYEVMHNETKTVYTLKVLRPIPLEKAKREVHILRKLQGGPHIVRLIDLIYDPESNAPSFLLENIDAVPLNQARLLDEPDVVAIMYRLFQALNYAHSHGIMHRDVKPQNILVDPADNDVRLIDWGLAEYYFPDRDLSVRVCSRFFKGPELLLNMRDYDYSLDMWSAGCVMAGLIFRRDYFLRGMDNYDQLLMQTKVLGADSLRRVVEKYNVRLDGMIKSYMSTEKYPGIGLQAFVTPENKHLATPQAIDLVSNLLKFDPQKRLTAPEALAHPYFNSLKEMEAVKQRALEKVRLSKESRAARTAGKADARKADSSQNQRSV